MSELCIIISFSFSFLLLYFFFFKQKTADEMRISDWSSDVCSSDLPDVRHRAGQLDVAHALAAHLRERDLDARLPEDDAAILHALVLAAQALVVLDRTEDAREEQAVPFRLEGTVVDGLRLLDLAVGPGPDALRAGDRNADLVEALRAGRLAKNVHQLRHRFLPIRNTVSAGGAGSEERALRRLLQVYVQAQRAELLHEHVEGFRDAGFEIVVALDDGLIDLGAARDVVRLHRQHLLQGVGGAVGLQGPDLHLAETLAAELRLAAQRLLGDQAVGADGAGVDLVVHQGVQSGRASCRERGGK